MSGNHRRGQRSRPLDVSPASSTPMISDSDDMDGMVGSGSSSVSMRQMGVRAMMSEERRSSWSPSPSPRRSNAFAEMANVSPRLDNPPTSRRSPALPRHFPPRKQIYRSDNGISFEFQPNVISEEEDDKNDDDEDMRPMEDDVSAEKKKTESRKRTRDREAKNASLGKENDKEDDDDEDTLMGRGGDSPPPPPTPRRRSRSPTPTTARQRSSSSSTYTPPSRRSKKKTRREEEASLPADYAGLDPKQILDYEKKVEEETQKRLLEEKKNGAGAGQKDGDIEMKAVGPSPPIAVLGKIPQINPFFNSTNYKWEDVEVEAKEKWKAEAKRLDDEKDLRSSGGQVQATDEEERNWHIDVSDGDAVASRAADDDTGLADAKESARRCQFRKLLKTNYEDLEPDEMEVWLRRWDRCLTDFVASPQNKLTVALDLWSWTKTDQQARTAMDSASHILKDLKRRLQESGRINSSGTKEQKALHDLVTRCFSQLIGLFLLRQMSSPSDQLENMNSSLQACIDMDMHDDSKRMPELSDKERTDQLDLQEKTLNLIQVAGLVRIKGFAYEPVKNPDGFDTRGYQRYRAENGKEGGEIIDFIHDCGYPENIPTKREYFYSLSRNLNSIPALKNRMESIRSIRYPEVSRERDWHAFWNGIWDVRKARWYPISSKAFQNLPRDRVPCVLHKCNFDYYEYMWYLRTEKGKPVDELAFMKVPSPVDGIIDCQEWQWHEKKPSEEPIWILAEGGALLFSKRTATHPIRKYVPTYIGPGGLGKTTLLKIFSAFYDPLDVAQFKTKDEEVFGFERLPESYIWMGYDIGRDWKIDHTFLFTLIDGGWVKINVKFKRNFQYYVEQYGMLAMNDYLNLPDTGGAWSRRNLLHRFRNPPPKGGDDELLTRAEADPGSTLFKCTMAIRYLTKTLKSKKSGVCRDTMPASMWSNLQEMRRSTNPLMNFFSSSGVVTRQDPDYYVSMDDFNAAFKQFCKDTGVSKRAKLDAAVSHDVITMFGCSIVRGERYNPGAPDETKMGKEAGWLVGGTLRTMVEGCTAILTQGRQERSAKGIEWAKKQAVGSIIGASATTSVASAASVDSPVAITHTVAAAGVAPMVIDSTAPMESKQSFTGTTASKVTPAKNNPVRTSRRAVPAPHLLKGLFSSFDKMSLKRKPATARKAVTT